MEKDRVSPRSGLQGLYEKRLLYTKLGHKRMYKNKICEHRSYVLIRVEQEIPFIYYIILII